VNGQPQPKKPFGQDEKDLQIKISLFGRFRILFILFILSKNLIVKTNPCSIHERMA